MIAGSQALPVGSSAAPVDTPLQKALRDYLTTEEQELFAADSPFIKAIAVLNLSPPLTKEAVIAHLLAGDVDECASNLPRIARSFKRNALNVRDVSADKSKAKAHQAMLKILLVVSEAYVKQVENKNQPQVVLPYDLVQTQQRLLSCILAAARVGCGLGFKEGMAEPWNVVDAYPPPEELAFEGRESHGGIHGEVLKALDQLDMPPLERSARSGKVDPVGPKYFDTEVRLMIEEAPERFGAAPVLRVSVGDNDIYSAPDRRSALQDYLSPSSLKVFFAPKDDPAEAPAWIVNLLGELNRAFSAVFPPPSDQEVWQGVDKALGELQKLIESLADGKEKTELMAALRSVHEAAQADTSPGGKLKKLTEKFDVVRKTGETLEKLDNTIESGEKLAKRATAIVSTLGTFLGVNIGF